MTGDGAIVGAAGLVVTAAFNGFFYAETPDRTAGIRVHWGAPVQVGKIVDVEGLISTTAGMERFIEASRVEEKGEGFIAPFFMRTNTVGGVDVAYNAISGAGQRGIEGSMGPNNIGLLVTVADKVTGSRQGSFWFYVDEGGRVQDGTGIVGLYVKADGMTVPDPGAVVTVTGISSCERYKDQVVNVLLPRSQDDIVIHQPAAAGMGLALSGFSAIGREER